MTRIRTGNNRRRARTMKLGGLFTLQRIKLGGPRWGEAQGSPADALAHFRRLWASLS